MKTRGSKKRPAARWIWILAALTVTAGSGTALSTGRPAQAAEAEVTVQKKIRLDFVEANIADVIKALSIQSDTNIALMPTVTGSVTLRLMDLTLDESLKKVAAVVGADVRKFETTYFVGMTDELKALIARTGTRSTLKPRYASAENMKSLLEGALPYLTVQAVAAPANLLLLTGTPEDVEAAKKLVVEIDIAPPPVEKPKPSRQTYVLKYANANQAAEALRTALPEAEVVVAGGAIVINGVPADHEAASGFLTQYDVEGSEQTVVRAYQLKFLHPRQATLSLRKIFSELVIEAGPEPYDPPAPTFTPLSPETERAFSSKGLGGAAGGAGGAITTASELSIRGPGDRARAILLSGPPDLVEQAIQVLEALDLQPTQYNIQAKIVDIAPERAKELGFVWEWSSLTFFEKPPPPASPRVRTGNSPLSFGGIVRTPFDFAVTLAAMQTKKVAKLLAEPNIMVMDGTDASIFIGDILRFETLSTVTDGGSQQFNIEVVPVGIALLVRPRKNDDDTVTLRIHPVVSTVTGFTGRFNDIPVTASRETDSTIIMKNGETIAIGGLLRDEEIRTMSKIPILGDIPFLGELFRHRSKSRKKSEVTIFITVTMVD